MTLFTRILLIFPIIVFNYQGNAGRFPHQDDPAAEELSRQGTMQPGMIALEEREEERALAEDGAATPTALAMSPLKKLRDTVQGMHALWDEERTAMQAHSTAVSTMALASLERTQATVQNFALEVSATQVAAAILRMRVNKWKTKYEEEATLRKQAEHMEKCWRVACERLQAKLTKQKEAAARVLRENLSPAADQENLHPGEVKSANH